MVLGAKTWLYTKGVVNLERDEYGVYELLDSSYKVRYIGYGLVRVKLLIHFADGLDPITGARFYSVEYTWSEQKAKQRELVELDEYYKQYGKYPRFNQQ